MSQSVRTRSRTGQPDAPPSDCGAAGGQQRSLAGHPQGAVGGQQQGDPPLNSQPNRISPGPPPGFNTTSPPAYDVLNNASAVPVMDVLRDELGALNANITGLRTGLVTPKVFSGLPNENVLSWLEDFEFSAVANGWTDDIKRLKLPACLNGVARDWYSLEVAGRNTLWPDILRALISQFLPTGFKSHIREQIRSRKQMPYEPVNNYICEMRLLCRRYNPNMPEPEIKDYIIEGLLPPLAQQLIFLNPTDLNDLKVKAALVEKGFKKAQNLSAVPTSFASDVTAAISSDNHDLLAEIKSLRDEISQMKINQQAIPSSAATPQRPNPSPRINDGAPRCYICRSKNHRAAFCPNYNYFVPRNDCQFFQPNNFSNFRPNSYSAPGFTPNRPNTFRPQSNFPNQNFRPQQYNQRPWIPNPGQSNYSPRSNYPQITNTTNPQGNRSNNNRNRNGNNPAQVRYNNANPRPVSVIHERLAPTEVSDVLQQAAAERWPVDLLQSRMTSFPIIRTSDENPDDAVNAVGNRKAIPVEIEISGVCIEGVLDTGSFMSVIDSDLAYDLELPISDYTGPEATVANGAPLNPHGQAFTQIKICLDGISKEVPLKLVLVNDPPHPILLGDDFNYKASIMIDCVE